MNQNLPKLHHLISLQVMFCIWTTTCISYPLFHGPLCGICSLGNNFTESIYILYRKHIFCLIFQVFRFIEISFSDTKRLDQTSLFIPSHFPFICRFHVCKSTKMPLKILMTSKLKNINKNTNVCSI